MARPKEPGNARPHPADPSHAPRSPPGVQNGTITLMPNWFLNKLSTAMILAFLLAACGGQAATPLPTPPPLATLTPLPRVTVPVPTQPPTATPTALATQDSLFAPVTAADWQEGPADAAVTLVEYGDYQ
jgi:hypothetical protein